MSYSLILPLISIFRLHPPKYFLTKFLTQLEISLSHPSDRPEFKIVFRFSGQTLPSRQPVLETTYKVKVPLQGLIPSPSGYIEKAQSLEDIELLLKLASVLTRLSPLISSPGRRFFFRQVENFVGKHSESELRAEFQIFNPRVKVDKVAEILNWQGCSRSCWRMCTVKFLRQTFITLENFY